MNRLFVNRQKEEQRELTYILAIMVYPDGWFGTKHSMESSRAGKNISRVQCV